MALEKTIQYFFDKVRITKNCWTWTGYLNRCGYGVFKFDKKTYLAHRLLYEKLFGKIKKGLELDHLCRNRACVNPAHLEPVTHAENVKRGNGGKYWRDRKFCKHGHLYTEDNIRIMYLSKTSKVRLCRTCARIRDRKWKLKHQNDRNH